MLLPSKAGGRPGIAGIIAALILFVLLFTIGTSYFLYIYTNNNLDSQALINRDNSNQNQLSESVQIGVAVNMSKGTTNYGDLIVFPSNTGSDPVNITNVFANSASGQELVGSPDNLTGGMVLNPGDHETIQTTVVYPDSALTVGLLTERGNVFSDTYTPPTVTTTLSSPIIGNGSSAYDSATVSNGYFPTGTVTYSYFGNGGCTGTGTTVGVPEVIANGVAPPSPSVKFTATGVYGWEATYSGDEYNPSAISTCEQLHVDTTTHLSTTLFSSSIGPGDSFEDNATLSAATPTAGGTIIFYYSSADLCPNPSATFVSKVTVDGNGNYSSGLSGVMPVSTTPYYVYANYTGDSSNLGTTSSCEPLTVGLGITTALSADVVTAGRSVYDTATLHYNTTTAGGTVSYQYFTGAVCSGSATPVPPTVTVTDGVVPRSSAVMFNLNGTYSWDAIYSGDAQNRGPVTSPCEVLTVLPVVSSSGTLGLVSESFKFYYTDCNPTASEQGNYGLATCGSGTTGLGDGVSAGGYFAYGLSFDNETSCGSYYGHYYYRYGESNTCPQGSNGQYLPYGDIFEVSLTNTDPSRTVILSDQTFLLIQAQCQPVVHFFGRYYVNNPQCGYGSVPFSSGYWIIEGVTSSGGNGAVPIPYNNSAPISIPPGQTKSIFFFCQGAPCPSAAAMQSDLATNLIPEPGQSLVISIGLYGQYSDGTPFGEVIPYVASYTSPVVITSTNPALSAGAYYIVGKVNSQITLNVGNFPTDPLNVTVWWSNSDGTISDVTNIGGFVPNSCTAVTVSGYTSYSCSVTFTVPPTAQNGEFYGIYVTSDGVDNAYATVFVSSLNPSITLTPSSGPLGTVVSVSGTGFEPNTKIGSIAFSGGTITSQTCTAQTTAPDGSFTCTFTVPSSTSGSHSVTVDGSDIGTNPADGASATFIVTVPGIVLTPSQGPVGTMVTVTGSGFAPDSNVRIEFNGGYPATNPATITTDLSGSFTATFVIPSCTGFGCTGGKTVAATDASGNTASATFTVTTATLTLSPTQGPVGTLVTLSGTGYAPGTVYAYCFQATAVACPSGTGTTFTATAGGAIPTGITITVPSSGNSHVDVSQGTVGTNFIISATFTVTTATLTLTPSSGSVGTVVTLSGSGYAPGTVYAYCFQATAVACPSGTGTTFTATAGGAIPTGITITVPSSGNSQVDVNQGNTGTNFIISAPFTVLSPSITLSPTSGKVGTSVTVTGSGFAVTSTVTITLDGVLQGTTPATITTSASGAFTATFVVPASTAGAQTVTATDASANTASATFTVTPSITLSPTTGPVGTTVTVSGTGFAGTSTITITFSGTMQTTTPATVTTNSVGSFSATFVVPLSSGSNTVTATDASGDAASATFTVTLRTTTTSVSCSPATVAVNQATTCTATVTDTSSGTAVTPTGTVTFTQSPSGSGTFSSTTCTLSGSGATATCSVTFTPSAVRTVTITGSYGGDTYHSTSSGSFSLIVTKTSPTIATALSTGSIGAGGSVHDAATLSGETATAGGTVQYEYFSSSTCSGGATDVGTAVTVTNGIVPNSPSQQFNTPGSYGWEAVYSGDANNNGVTSSCEALTITAPTGPAASYSAITNDVTFSGGSGFAPSTVYSYCLSSTSTSVSNCVFSTEGTFTSTATGTVPSTSFLVPTGDRSGTWYVLVYEGTTVITSTSVTT